jgi:hypothetical protein
VEKGKPKGVPPVTPKSQKREELSRYQRADTGGDPYDRMMGNYSKMSNKKSGEDDSIFPADF